MEKGSGIGLSLYLAGADSTAALTKCSIAGVIQGVHVDQGAKFNAEELECVGRDWLALRALGKGSTLSLSHSTLHDSLFSELTTSEISAMPVDQQGTSMGIQGRIGSVLSIVGSSMSGFNHGFFAHDAHVSMKQCYIQDYAVSGYACMDCLCTEFVGCTFSRVHGLYGMMFTQPERRMFTMHAAVTGCNFHQMKGNALLAFDRGSVIASDCLFFGNVTDLSATQGGSIHAVECNSSDAATCMLAANGHVMAERMVVDSCAMGIGFTDAAGLVQLKDCRMVCSQQVARVGFGKLELQGCTMVCQNRIPSLTPGLTVLQGAELIAKDSEFQNVVVKLADSETRAELVRSNVKCALVGVTASVVVGQSASALLRGCIVQGGIFTLAVLEKGSSVVAYDTVFQGAGSGGARVSSSARLDMHDCAVRICWHCGAVVWGAGSQMLLTGGSIENCGGQGIMASAKAAVEANDLHVKGMVCTFLVRKEGIITLSGCVSEASRSCFCEDSSGGKLYCMECCPNDMSRAAPPGLDF